MRTPEDNNLNGEKLAKIIDQRHACLVQMQKLGVKQSELVALGEVGSLLRLLSVKNQLIVALQSVEQQLAPYHLQDPHSRAWPNEALRERCANQIEHCQLLLDEIMQMERDNEKKMADRRDHLASQLQSAQSANNARRAYQVHQRNASRPVAPETQDTELTTELHVEA